MIFDFGCQGITEAEWRPQWLQTTRHTNGGDTTTLTLGVPYWIVDVRIDTASRQAFRRWDAWINSRRASKVPFLMAPTFRMFPEDQTPLSDAGLTVSATDPGASTVSLSGAGSYTAHPGDMLSYYTAYGGFWFGQVTEEATATGGSITIPVTPYPFPAHASQSRPRRIIPAAEFYLSDDPGRTGNPTTNFLEFEARQFIRGQNAAASPIANPAQAVTRTLMQASWPA